MMSGKRIPSLDGLRAVAITLVILNHLVKWRHITLEIPDAYGLLGVHMFFVLSGYLITHLLLQEYDRDSTISLRRFYIRRAFRIFPAAFAFLSVVIVLYWKQISWVHIATALFYVANMDSSRPWMFGHLWSLSIEEQFYLIWPLAVKKWHAYKIPILLSVFVLTPIFRGLLYAFNVNNGVLGSVPVFADQLAIGCLLAVFAPRLRKISKTVATIMVFAAVLIPLYQADRPLKTVFMLFALRPLLDVSLAGIVLHVMQTPYRFLNFKPVSWLGRISYSLYLWQELFCSNPAFHLGYSLVLPALGCACLSYYFVEKPMLRLREKHAGNDEPHRSQIVLAKAAA